MYITRYELGKIFPNNKTYEFNNRKIVGKNLKNNIYKYTMY